MIRFRDCLSLLVLLTMIAVTAGQDSDDLFADSDDLSSQRKPLVVDGRGPLKDVSYEVLWLIESEDVNRKPYAGPAREGLTEAGFGRLVHAGSVRSAVTIGKSSVVSGQSRYGPMTLSTSMLNTTANDQLQIDVELLMRSKAPITIDTSVRVPLGHWFLLGSAASQVGIPLHEADGNRSVLIMRITNGALLLD